MSEFRNYDAPRNVDEYEVDLRKYVEVLLKGKWIIAGILVISVLAAGLVSVFGIEPVYEAKATLLVSVPSPRGAERSESQEIIERSMLYSSFSLETFRAQVASTPVMDRVIKRLGLPMSAHELASKVEVTVPKDTTLLEIKVSDTNPKQAAELANVIAQEYIAYVEEVNRDRLAKIGQFVSEMLADEDEKLREATQQLQSFVSQPDGVEKLDQEITARLNLLSSYRLQIVEIEVRLKSTEAVIKEIQTQLKTEPPTIKVKRSVVDEPGAALGANLNADYGSNLSGRYIEVEEVNPTYVMLTSRLAENQLELARLRARLTGLLSAITELEQDIAALQGKKVEKEAEETRLRKNLERAQISYEGLSDELRRTQIAEAARTAETLLTLISPSVEPVKPVKPRVLLNVAVAAVLGLMVGVLAVFAKEYFEAPLPSKT